jgi:hypothetical protein
MSAGMSAEQLTALAGVVGAAHAPGVDALRLAHEQAEQQVEKERLRREREVDKDRRHQLELLALQNDVNKAALASQAQLGTRVARAAAACAHPHAGSGDRYCGSCGAALPARE